MDFESSGAGTKAAGASCFHAYVCKCVVLQVIGHLRESFDKTQTHAIKTNANTFLLTDLQRLLTKLDRAVNSAQSELQHELQGLENEQQLVTRLCGDLHNLRYGPGDFVFGLWG